MTEAEFMPPEEPQSKVTRLSDEVFESICDQMANGKGLREICSAPSMPSRSAFLRSVEKDTARLTAYQQAREALMDFYAEQILVIAWDDSQDTITGKDGERKCNHEWINRSRLKVDALKWTMAKLHPRKYGDRLPELLSAPTPASESKGGTIFPAWGTIYSIRKPDGGLMNPDSPEYEAIVERAARLAHAEGLKEYTVGDDLQPWIDAATNEQPAPLQIEYQPDPLAANLSADDGALLIEVLNLIRSSIPEGDTSPPETVLRVMRQALRMHFREVSIDGAERAA